MKKKILNMEKNKLIFLVIYVLLSIFSLFYLVQRSADKGFLFIGVFGIIVLALEVIGFFFLKRQIEKEKPLEKIYLPIAIFFGVLYLFAFPLSQLPDEKADYLRSLEVANFHATSVQKDTAVGREFSTNIEKVYESENYEDMLEVSDLKLNDETKFYTFSNKSLYAFVCYLPQAFGVGVSSLLGASIVWQSLIGKIFNYAFFVLLIYLSIKYIPFKKMLVFFIALLPMTMQEAVSLSPDAMTIAVSVALIAFILYFRNGMEKKLQKKHYIILSSLVVALSLCKIVYLPLCFLIFLIPTERFQSKKQKYLFCSILSILVILLNLFWLKISSQYLVAFESRSNSSLQLQYILQNPLRYIITIFATIDSFSIAYLEQLVGHSLGKFNVSTSSVMVIISLGILFYLISKRNKNKKLHKPVFSLKEKLYILVMLLGTILLMFTSLYMQWTAVYSDTIDGVQGRYFIPLLLVIAMLWMSQKEKDSPDENNNFISCSVMTNIMALVSIFATFI